MPPITPAIRSTAARSFSPVRAKVPLSARRSAFWCKNLNTRPDPHRLVHVVTWGVTGATEPIVEMINRYRQGYGRDFSPALERHWSLTAPEHGTAIPVWNDLGARWSGLGEEAVDDHVRSVARQMHVIGYFFDIDPFARVGTFLGEPLAFPVELVLPQRCERLVTELVLDTRIGDVGLRWNRTS